MRNAKRQELAQNAARKKEDENKTSRGRAVFRRAALWLFVVLLVVGGYQVLMHPETPLPRAWNPLQPLHVADPVSPLTGFKLDRTAADLPQCLAALEGAAAVQALPDRNASSACHIRGRVALRGVGDAALAELETRCAIALRLAMWERHTLQPAAAAFMGTTLTGMDHFGSYSCRRLRSPSGTSDRMSTHATADAVDVAGFRFADGQRVNLLSGWDGNGAEAAFLRAARDGACRWFELTLSPDYNRLHADHFHLQSTGWGLCR